MFRLFTLAFLGLRSRFGRLTRSKGFLSRVVFCWAFACTLPLFDEVKDYDLRFRMRGDQPISDQIVEVFFDQEDWTSWHGQSSSSLIRSLKEMSVINDSYFWHSKTWNSLLEKILKQSPKSVGVTFFFSDQLPAPDETLKALNDPRVIWASQFDNEGRLILPLMAKISEVNVAPVDLHEDQDRVLRRFSWSLIPLPHMGMKLVENIRPGFSMSDFASFSGVSRPINFRGGPQMFPHISALSILEDRAPPDLFTDKIVVIGTHSVASHQFQTPLGPMSRADILAQVLDNMLAKRWISRLTPGLAAMYYLVILILAVAIIVTYPQAVASVFLIWLSLGTTALSLWVFDSFYFWLPAFSMLVLILVTYVVFLGYQLYLKENQTWRLEQEKSLLSELDQLRNNFVSLISHDLKTPIAKIQAICDRLMTGELRSEVKEGLQSLRKESVELHRYIQSILQLTRLESGSPQIRREATDLNELAESVMSQLKPLAEDKRQTLESVLEPLFSIEVDSVMIQEVILNLVENAIKYSPNGSRILVQSREVEDRVIFTVTDPGPGIPKDDQEHIFEKFFRGRATSSHIKGTGLGLFLAKYFIELHGGEVFLESGVGRGTKVGFTLPLQAIGAADGDSDSGVKDKYDGGRESERARADGGLRPDDE